MKNRIAKIFIIDTNSVLSLNIFDVINDAAESKLPVAWNNYGQYRLVPQLLIKEFIRLYQQWEISSKRLGGIEHFKRAIYWDDCLDMHAQTIFTLLGEDTPDSDDDDGEDKANN